MNNKTKVVVLGCLLLGIGFLIIAFCIWQFFKVPAMTGDWQTPLSRLSSAEFHGDLVTVKNVRNFQYNGSEEEKDLVPDWYDRTYDLSKLSKVWFVSEPFKDLSIAAHTFVSFEFSDGNFLSISIEARKLKGQQYDLFQGLLRTYPLMYIAADERDAILVRANIRHAEVELYPVKTTPEKGRALLVDMLNKMNDLGVHPDWYNTANANCTSQIAWHVNRVTPGRISSLTWQTWVTGFADAAALQQGLLDTDLPIAEARKKYSVSKRSREIGNVEDYSTLIREF